MKKNEIKVIEINKPSKEEAQKKIKELSLYLSHNWISNKSNE